MCGPEISPDRFSTLRWAHLDTRLPDPLAGGAEPVLGKRERLPWRTFHGAAVGMEEAAGGPNCACCSDQDGNDALRAERQGMNAMRDDTPDEHDSMLDRVDTHTLISGTERIPESVTDVIDAE